MVPVVDAIAYQYKVFLVGNSTQVCTYPPINFPTESTALPASENSSISHTQMTCQPGAGAFTVWPGRFFSYLI